MLLCDASRGGFYSPYLFLLHFQINLEHFISSAFICSFGASGEGGTKEGGTGVKRRCSQDGTGGAVRKESVRMTGKAMTPMKMFGTVMLKACRFKDTELLYRSEEEG